MVPAEHTTNWIQVEILSVGTYLLTLQGTILIFLSSQVSNKNIRHQCSSEIEQASNDQLKYSQELFFCRPTFVTKTCEEPVLGHLFVEELYYASMQNGYLSGVQHLVERKQMGMKCTGSVASRCSRTDRQLRHEDVGKAQGQLSEIYLHK